MSAPRYLIWTALACALSITALYVGSAFLGWWRTSNLEQIPVVVGLACVIGLACLHVIGKGRMRAVMWFGIVSAVLAAALVSIHSIWQYVVVFGRATNSGGYEELRWAGWTAFLAALVPAQWGLLALLRLQGRFARMARTMAQCLAMLCFSVVCIGIWGVDRENVVGFVSTVILLHVGMLGGYLLQRQDQRPPTRLAVYGGLAYVLAFSVVIWERDLIGLLSQTYLGGSYWYWWWWETVVGLTVLVALIATGFVPAMAWLEAMRRGEDVGSFQSRQIIVTLVCPRCQQSQAIHTGAAACASCGLKFQLDIEEPHCECGYLLYQLHQGRCPECGRQIVNRTTSA